MGYAAMLEPADDGSISVWVPDLPGCVSRGDTREEALAAAVLDARHAARAAGAQGFKALGASGGGCVLIVSEADDVSRVVTAVAPYGERLPWRIATTGVAVSPNVPHHQTASDDL